MPLFKSSSNNPLNSKPVLVNHSKAPPFIPNTSTNRSVCASTTVSTSGFNATKICTENVSSNVRRYIFDSFNFYSIWRSNFNQKWLDDFKSAAQKQTNLRIHPLINIFFVGEKVPFVDEIFQTSLRSIESQKNKFRTCPVPYNIHLMFEQTSNTLVTNTMKHKSGSAEYPLDTINTPT